MAYKTLSSDQQYQSFWGTHKEDRIPSYTPNLLNENLHFNKILILKRFSGKYKFEKYCSVIVALDLDYELK